MILDPPELGSTDRDIYLYDTFEGMTEPTEHDVSDARAARARDLARASGGDAAWPEFFDAGRVQRGRRARVRSRRPAIPPERLHFVRGPVEETIPGAAPERLALLRLDTDWYESTRHELDHLYPRLATAAC